MGSIEVFTENGGGIDFLDTTNVLRQQLIYRPLLAVLNDDMEDELMSSFVIGGLDLYGTTS